MYEAVEQAQGSIFQVYTEVSRTGQKHSHMNDTFSQRKGECPGCPQEPDAGTRERLLQSLAIICRHKVLAANTLFQYPVFRSSYRKVLRQQWLTSLSLVVLK